MYGLFLKQVALTRGVTLNGLIVTIVRSFEFATKYLDLVSVNGFERLKNIGLNVVRGLICARAAGARVVSNGGLSVVVMNGIIRLIKVG